MINKISINPLVYIPLIQKPIITNYIQILRQNICIIRVFVTHPQ